MTNDELRGAIYTTRALLKQAADALQENVDSLTKSHTDPVTGLVDDEARLSIESDQDLIDRLRAAVVPVCQKPAPVQEPVATLWQHGETGRTRITMPGDITDCDARWFKAADLYTTPPAAQPASEEDMKVYRAIADNYRKDFAAAQPAPMQGPLAFNCSAGCGACGVKLQDFVTHQTQAHEGDEWVVIATQPQIVSTCCGSPVDVWDERKQDITASVDATPPAQPVASLNEVDVLMMAEAHGIDPGTKGLYGFYIDCISNQPTAQPAPVQEWMKPHPKCDEGCMYHCTKGYTQFPECATTPPAAQPAASEGWKLVPAVPTNEWVNNLAKMQTGNLEEVPFVEIHQCIAELLAAAPEKGQP